MRPPPSPPTLYPPQPILPSQLMMPLQPMLPSSLMLSPLSPPRSRHLPPSCPSLAAGPPPAQDALPASPQSDLLPNASPLALSDFPTALRGAELQFAAAEAVTKHSGQTKHTPIAGGASRSSSADAALLAGVGATRLSASALDRLQTWQPSVLAISVVSGAAMALACALLSFAYCWWARYGSKYSSGHQQLPGSEPLTLEPIAPAALQYMQYTGGSGQHRDGSRRLRAGAHAGRVLAARGPPSVSGTEASLYAAVPLDPPLAPKPPACSSGCETLGARAHALD
mmetsp:Transcript_50342/g.116214  ORF Transcript_50342/g.116214 Transcript_50342/m.116214 type:complete len:283 (-) Transcript_50342:401-1249(-)